MNLRQELHQLATAAPPPADTDRLLRLVRRRKACRAGGTALAAGLVVVIAFVPGWRPPSPPPAEPPTSTRTVLTLVTTAPINLELKRRHLSGRVLALGLGSPHFTQLDARTVELSVDGEADENLLRSVVLPHPLHVRKILDSLLDKASQTPGDGVASTRAQVIAQLGDAYQAALSIQKPGAIDAATMARLAPFGELSGVEVELLPPEVQFAVPQVTCAHLRARPTFTGLPLHEKVTTCLGPEKLLLDTAKLSSDDVAYAEARHGGDVSNPVVAVGLTEPGKARFTQLSEEAFTGSGATTCSPAAQGAQGKCRLAFSLGAYLFYAPEILGTLTSDLEIGGLTREQTVGVADVLSAGDPPTLLMVVSVQVRRVPAES